MHLQIVCAWKYQLKFDCCSMRCVCVCIPKMASIVARGRAPKWKELARGWPRALSSEASIRYRPFHEIRLFFVRSNPPCFFFFSFLPIDDLPPRVSRWESRLVGPRSSSIKAADFRLRIHTTTCSFI